MKFKKSLSMGLAAALMFSGTAITAYADEAAEAAMKQALTYVKQRIIIPEDLTTFDYYKSTSYGKDSYSFTWSTDENYDGYRCLNVEVRGKVIIGYEEYGWSNSDESENEYSFGKLSQEEILVKAEEWVKKLNPTVYKNIEVVKDSLSVSVYSERAYVTIRRVSDGIPIKGQDGYIVINKNTGELTSYGLNWIIGAGFPDYDDTISKSEAQKSFSEKIPLELVYTTTYDWEKDEYIPHLLYRQTNFSDIDALSGELTTFEGSYFNYYSDFGEDDTAAEADIDDANPGAGGDGVSFSEAELEKMQLEGTLMTPEEALKYLIDTDMFQLGENPAVSYSYTYRDGKDGDYMMSLTISSKDTVYYITEDKDTGEDVQKERNVTTTAYASINAQTGELLSFNSSGSLPTETKITAANAQRILNKYAEKLAGDKVKEFKLDDVSLSYSKLNKDGTPAEGAYVVTARVSSPRYIYDIPTMSEDMSLKINREGKITSYNINYLGLEYPKPENILSEDEVFEKYFEQIEYELEHRLAVKEDIVYTAIVYEADYDLNIDAFSGKLTNSEGYEIVRTSKGGYTDLKDSKYKEIAEKLAAYDITLMDENGRLNANEYITRAEFSSLMSNVGSWYYNRTGGEKVLTRQFAAKILTNRLIDEKCAELTGIFNCPFSDVKKSNKYIAYITLANALGYMTGDENGSFNPSQKVTRGEALLMVYERLA